MISTKSGINKPFYCFSVVASIVSWWPTNL